MFAETSSSAYGSVASLVDALLARHATFPPQREEPKERLRGRLIEVELLEISVLKGKLPLSFGQWKLLADNTHTYMFSFKNTLFVELILRPCFLSRNGGLWRIHALYAGS